MSTVRHPDAGVTPAAIYNRQDFSTEGHAVVGRLRRGERSGERAEGAPAPVSKLRLVGDDAYPDWEAVYQDNVDRVYAMMYAKVGNRSDAEDLTVEVFLAALGPLRVSASVGEVRAYLSATARTVLAGHWRRHYGREITVLAEMPDVPAPVPDDGDHDQLVPAGAASAAEAADMLAGLPEEYGQVLRRRYLQGYSVRDTATAMGTSVSNAKVLQHRAQRETEPSPGRPKAPGAASAEPDRFSL